MEDENIEDMAFAARLFLVAVIAALPLFFQCLAILEGNPIHIFIASLASLASYIACWWTWVVTKPKRKLIWLNDVHIEIKTLERE